MSGRIADTPHAPRSAVPLLVSVHTLPSHASWIKTPQPPSDHEVVSEMIFGSNCGLLVEVPEFLLRLATDPDGLFANHTYPSLTVNGRGNACVLDERWYLIHYQDGTEEFYDMHQDPFHWPT